MKLLVDFGAIKSGGGAQLAVNFLDQLEGDSALSEDVYLLLPEVGPLAEKKLTGKYRNIYRSPKAYLQRFLFENFHLPRLIRAEKIDRVYTFFGAGVPCPKNVKSIVSVAYPIICYPESPYWGYVGWQDKYRKLFINFLRKRRLRRADRIIAETEIMKARLARELAYPAENIQVLPPTPSSYVSAVEKARGADCVTLLFLSGNDAHKNLWRLPAVAQALYDLDFHDFKFLLTVDRQRYLQSLGDRPVAAEILQKHFEFVGTVAPQAILNLYARASFIVSLSDLESFSNNYMEAWKTGTPVIASDRDFARHICGDSAIYVEPHDSAGVARALVDAAGNAGKIGTMLEAGREKLEALPDFRQRFEALKSCILQV